MRGRADAHHLPGRIRVPVRGLRGDRAFALRLQARLSRLPGVRLVHASPDSGRVLICYDPGCLDPRLLPAAPRSAAPAPPATPPAAGGLSTAEARSRLRRCGPNTLRSAPEPSFWQHFARELQGTMVLTLLGGAGLALLVGRVRDALTIGAVLGLNAAVGATQASKATGATAALRRMEAPEATVLRDGRPTVIPAAGVVPGDVLLLEAGCKVPADAVVVAAVRAEAEESMLTGESLPVAKWPAGTGAPGDGGCGRPDMVYAGTTITRGRVTAVVTATGMTTEMGRIAGLLDAAREAPTPLQQRMDELGRTLVKGALLVCGGLFAVGLLRGQPAADMFLTGVSLAVAAIPEGLPTFVSLALATGVQQMARRRALVRRLQAVETLGSATVICSDKTGTLTRNQMTVRQVYTGGQWFEVAGAGYDPQGAFLKRPAGGRRGQMSLRVDPRREPDLLPLLRAGALCNNAALQAGPEGWRVVGDTTEGALLAAAAKAGLQPPRLAAEHRRTAEIPFDSDRRRMTVVCAGPEGPCTFCKGAPEAVLAVCTGMARGDRRVPLTAPARRSILAAAEAMAGRAYRVLALACGPTAADGGNSTADPEQGLTFLGLVGLMDPPRPEVPAAIARCRRAGIRVIMLTGDHPRTAAAVAEEIGLLQPGDLVTTGAELAAMSDSQLAGTIERLAVCARVSPEQKLRVVRALRSRGHVVAMTGDGVNDAPAVKEADIGVAMGKGGTEVTRAAASLVLADDNFATIVAAVEQGRVTYNNLRRSIRYLLASNVGELVVMSGALLLGLPLPLLALQLLWLNLVGDGLPALALGAEPADGTEMTVPPRPRCESLFAGGLGRQIVRHGLKMGLAGLGLFVWALWAGQPLPVVRTLTLCTLLLGQLLYVARCQGRRAGPQAGNRAAGWAVAGSAALLAASFLLAPLRRLLQLTPLPPGGWAIAGLAAAAGTMGG